MLDFELIGLKNRDRRVYEALLLLPRSSVRRVAEETGINRGSVFESIKVLTTVGLVAHIKEGKRRQYAAQSPELLHEVIAERRRDLRVLQSEIDDYVLSLMPEKAVEERQFAAFYEGDEGLASILRDVLSTCRQQGVTEYRIMPSERVSAYLYANFHHYTRERIGQKLFVKSLRQDSRQVEDAPFSETRRLPGVSKDTGCYIIVYGSKVATISVNIYNVASGIVVDNEGVAVAQAALFDAAWEVCESFSRNLAD